MRVLFSLVIQDKLFGFYFAPLVLRIKPKRYLAVAVSNDAAAGHQTAPLFQVGGLPEGDSTTGPGARITCWYFKFLQTMCMFKFVSHILSGQP